MNQNRANSLPPRKGNRLAPPQRVEFHEETMEMTPLQHLAIYLAIEHGKFDVSRRQWRPVEEVLH